MDAALEVTSLVAAAVPVLLTVTTTGHANYTEVKVKVEKISVKNLGT